MLLHQLTMASSHAPLVVFVHGRGGNLGVMRPFQRVVPPGCSTLYIQAPIPDTDIGGFSWWLVGGGAKPRLETGKELIKEVVEILEHSGADPEKIVGIGFSQGGAVLSLAIQDEPGFFSSIAMLASFALNSESPLEGEVRANTTRVLMINGDADPIVPIEKAQTSRDKLIALGFSVEFLAEQGVGHKLGSLGLRELGRFVVECLAG